jgi:hypothetical protein
MNRRSGKEGRTSRKKVRIPAKNAGYVESDGYYVESLHNFHTSSGVEKK